MSNRELSDDFYLVFHDSRISGDLLVRPYGKIRVAIQPSLFSYDFLFMSCYVFIISLYFLHIAMVLVYKLQGQLFTT